MPNLPSIEILHPMNDLSELIPVEAIASSEPTINLRDVHTWLEVTSKYANWMPRRIKQGGFEEGVDYLTFKEVSIPMDLPKSGNDIPKTEYGISPTRFKKGKSVEYYATADMVKHLAMMERTDKGRVIRQYFITCEYKLQEVEVRMAELPITMRLLRAAHKTAKVVLGPKLDPYIYAQVASNMVKHVTGFDYLKSVNYDRVTQSFTPTPLPPTRKDF